jgi:[acyl-carrier-protein] S-malonyltransferase
MSKTAFVFPGQGSQYVGMLKDIHEKFDLVKNLINNSNQILGFDISKIMFEGPVDSLKLTDITQPAIFIHSSAILGLFNKIKPDMAAGHSLGEYSALVAANAIDFEQGLKLVRLRGQAMLEAGINQQGTMAAIVGLTNETVTKICEEASSEGIVQCANFNSPGQIVISGSVNGIRKAVELAKLNKAKLAKELIVSGAFHSPLMESAKEKLLENLNEIEFKNAEFPVYANVTARPVLQNNEIKELLFQQLTSPVRWEETIRNMINDGAKTFYEIGPGKVLQGLIKRIDSSAEVFGIDTLADLERFI